MSPPWCHRCLGSPLKYVRGQAVPAGQSETAGCPLWSALPTPLQPLPSLPPVRIASGDSGRGRAPAGETESRGQGGRRAPPLPLSLAPLGKAGQGGGALLRCQEALPQPPRLLCVGIFRGPVGNLSVLVAAWESPLGKVLKIHSIVVYY